MALLNKLKNIKDRTIGMLLTFLVIVLFYMGTFSGLELKTYDMRMAFAPAELNQERVTIIAIDAESIASLGRWPWSRDKVATVVEKLKSYGAKVIGLDILFTEPEEASGLKAVRHLKDRFTDLGLENARKGKKFYDELTDLELNLDNDGKLREAIENAGNVVMPLVFDFNPNMAGGEKSVPEFVFNSSIGGIIFPLDNYTYAPFDASSMLYPVEHLGNVSAGIGHLNKFPGHFGDGIDRWEALFVYHNDEYYPSFAASVAAKYMGVNFKEISGDLRDAGGTITLGKVDIMVDGNLGALINYYNPEDTFPTYSFYDVYYDKITPDIFKDKIVLIGMTDVGLGDAGATPLNPLLTGVEREATVIENILTNSFILQSDTGILTLGLIILLGLLTTLAVSRLSAMLGSMVSFILFFGVIGFGYYMFMEGVWYDIAMPAAAVLVNYTVISSRKFWFAEEGMEAAMSQSDEANKLLGLTFQSKGMLEMAWDKFIDLPVTDEIKQVLYDLALDFEKKRNWPKAVGVYERINDEKFRDVGTRLAKVLSIVGGGPSPVNLKGDNATIIADGSEMPTLGRYEVISELGRGAMGIVYKGRDPKINREVAIKTVNFDEVEEKMIDKIKSRFFREAESAGTLNHPNILTIYDVGEEGNLAYIAMELIHGTDLETYAQKDSLLSVKEALLLIATVAEALDFAHSKGIIHRDIKPANIMIQGADKTVKVADFGIARIQSASQTKTGTVMGTPSYMSPEQVAGKKVDGKSDLFSLTVTLYEILTGERPFQGESIANIMYHITSSPPIPINKFRPDLPQFCQALINKGLAKNAEARYKSGLEMSQAIKYCINKYGV